MSRTITPARFELHFVYPCGGYISCDGEDTGLEIEEVYCIKGEAFSNWVSCPTSRHTLMIWLG